MFLTNHCNIQGPKDQFNMKLRDYIEELSFAIDFIFMDSTIDIISIGEIQYTILVCF